MLLSGAIDYHRLPTRIFYTLVGSAVISILAIIFIVLWMSNTTNRVAAENSIALFKSALRGNADRLSVSVKDYGRWEEAYNWIAQEDHQAVDWNVGTGTTENSTFDIMYVIAADGTAKYAYQSGATGSDLSIIDRAVADRFMQEIAPEPVEPYASVTAYAMIDGHTVLVSAGRVQPYDASGFTANDLHVMIGGLELTPAALAEISESLLLKNAALFASDAAMPQGIVGLPLIGLDGQTIAKIGWEPPRPGDVLMWRSLPIVISLSIILLLGSLSIGRASGMQTAKIIEEKENARTDKLTGLMNRAGLEHFISTPAVAQATQNGHLAILYLDLNGFKQLNDTLGHESGDLALQITAKRMQSALRKNDAIARIGGDEFVVVIMDDDLTATASAIADRITQKTRAPLDLHGETFAARPSIGLAFSEPDMHWDTLLSHADTAMYRAKRQQQHRAVIYDSNITGKSAA